MQVKDRHAQLQRHPDGKYTVEDLDSPSGTWLNGKKLAAGQRATLCPGDEIAFGAKGDISVTYRIKLIHASVWDQLNGKAAPEEQKDSQRERDLLPA